jgi:hypothetical protein
MTHLPQPLVAAVGMPYMHVESGGMERCVAANAGSGGRSTGSGAAIPHLAWACSSHGCPDMDIGPDVRAQYR